MGDTIAGRTWSTIRAFARSIRALLVTVRSGMTVAGAVVHLSVEGVGAEGEEKRGKQRQHLAHAG